VNRRDRSEGGYTRRRVRAHRRRTSRISRAHFQKAGVRGVKLLGYLSDERFTAIPEASIELLSDDEVFILRSTPSGAIYGDVPPGHYRVTLAAPGFGSKRCEVDLQQSSTPHQFRLMSERLYGYVWPKWSRAGESASLR